MLSQTRMVLSEEQVDPPMLELDLLRKIDLTWGCRGPKIEWKTGACNEAGILMRNPAANLFTSRLQSELLSTTSLKSAHTEAFAPSSPASPAATAELKWR
jgi:hypothetical protein